MTVGQIALNALLGVLSMAFEAAALIGGFHLGKATEASRIARAVGPLGWRLGVGLTGFFLARTITASIRTWLVSEAPKVYKTIGVNGEVEEAPLTPEEVQDLFTMKDGEIIALRQSTGEMGILKEEKDTLAKGILLLGLDPSSTTLVEDAKALAEIAQKGGRLPKGIEITNVGDTTFFHITSRSGKVSAFSADDLQEAARIMEATSETAPAASRFEANGTHDNLTVIEGEGSAWNELRYGDVRLNTQNARVDDLEDVRVLLREEIHAAGWDLADARDLTYVKEFVKRQLNAMRKRARA